MNHLANKESRGIHFDVKPDLDADSTLEALTWGGNNLDWTGDSVFRATGRRRRVHGLLTKLYSASSQCQPVNFRGLPDGNR